MSSSRICACRKECARRDSGTVSYALGRVALAARSFELATQVIDGLPLVRHELFDPLSHAVLDASDLPPDLVDIGLLGPVALALAPESRVFVAQVGHRRADLAIEAAAIARLTTRDLLATVATENQDAAHLGLAWGAGGGVESATTFKSATEALLTSRTPPG